MNRIKKELWDQAYGPESAPATPAGQTRQDQPPLQRPASQRLSASPHQGSERREESEFALPLRKIRVLYSDNMAEADSMIAAGWHVLVAGSGDRGPFAMMGLSTSAHAAQVAAEAQEKGGAK